MKHSINGKDREKAWSSCLLITMKILQVKRWVQFDYLKPIYRGRPRKTIRETIRKDLEVNELDPNLVYDRTLA